MKKLFVFLLFFIGQLSVFAQSSVDPALAYNKYLVLNEGNTFTKVGAYKVIGSPYLLGKNHPGDVYSKSETGTGLYLSYNIYNQEIEFSASREQSPLIKEAGTLDSFIIKRDSLVKEDSKFIYGGLIGAGDKSYYQLISTGKAYNLYKKYRAELGIVSSNYIQAELRQFDLHYDYYYLDVKTKNLKKLKTNSNALKKEFSQYKDISSVIGQYQNSLNSDMALKKLFEFLNQ